MYNKSVLSESGRVLSRTVCPFSLLTQRPDILEELQKSQKVFAEKLNHLSRRLAWINSTIYSKVSSSSCPTP